MSDSWRKRKMAGGWVIDIELDQIHLAPQFRDWITLVAERQRHWYWRLWWAIRYLPRNVWDCLRGLRGEW